LLLKDTTSNIKPEEWNTGNYLAKIFNNCIVFNVIFNEKNCLGFVIFAAMLFRHSSVWLCGSAGTTTLRGRGLSGLASACLIDSEIR